jgi:hypothetical protein
MTELPPEDVRSVTPVGPAGAPSARQGLMAAVRRALLRFLALFLYLWVLFILFDIHQFLILSEHAIPPGRWGIGLVNALVLAKVMIVADELDMGARFRSRILLVPILMRSLLFATLFIVVDVLEKILIGAWHHRTLAESIPTYGVGGLAGSVLIALIVAFSLVPFFAFDEIDRALGRGRLWPLVLGRGER